MSTSRLGPSAENVSTSRSVERDLRATIGRLEMFRAFVDADPNGVLFVDMEGRIRIANLGAERLFGYEPRSLVGVEFEALLPERFRTGSAADRLRFAERPETRLMAQGAALFGLRRDGSEFPLEVALASFEGPDGPMLSAVVTDITARTEEQVRSAADRLEGMRRIDAAILSATSLRHVFENALARLGELIPTLLASVSRIDLDADRYDVVAVWGALEGSLAPDASIPIPSQRAVAPVLRGEVLTIPDITEPADVPSFEGAVVTIPDLMEPVDASSPDREPIAGPRSLAMYPLVAEGRTIGVLAIHLANLGGPTSEEHTILAEVAAQLAVALHQADLSDLLTRRAQALEERVEERTLELQQVNADLDTFAYSVAHDLRAPLRSMQGFSRLLLEDFGDRLGEEGRGFAARIAAAAERIDELIQDVLAYSRLSREEIVLAPASLGAIVDSALAQLEDQLTETGALVTIERPLPTVVAHASMLGQVVVNLIGNALKFVRPGQTPRITVRAERRNGRVRLWVQDEGIGVAPEHQERIFRMLERLHGIEVYPGTGVGLAIVRRAAERMRGDTGVESEEGSGSRFWIELIEAEETE